MRIVIAGGTGFLGRTLAASLRRRDHHVRVLTRRPKGPDDVAWSLDGGASDWTEEVAAADAVINLAGESIAGGRWTAARKAAIRSSRVRATKAIAAAIHAAPAPPRVLISGSAVGVYGPRGSEPLTEDAPAGSDFLARVCVEWEDAALSAQRWTRVVIPRTGLVLARDAGALPQMARPFRLFVGGPVGSGDQYLSWIHLDDWVALVEWLLDEQGTSGAVNATAPEPVTNREFGKAMGRVLGRPALLPAPAFALRLALGEMADALLLSGQRVVPARALAGGFEFRYPTIEAALRAIYAAPA